MKHTKEHESPALKTTFGSTSEILLSHASIPVSQGCDLDL
jgi:hypothetical protein